jgi:hypothetical protein
MFVMSCRVGLFRACRNRGRIYGEVFEEKCMCARSNVKLENLHVGYILHLVVIHLHQKGMRI